MIREYIYKNAKCIKISDEFNSIVILPEHGGKIASIYNIEKKFELLFQNPYDSYKKAELDSDFAKFDASGFDDCYPAIDEGEVTYGNERVMNPDHGEVWCSIMDFEILDEFSVKLWLRSAILPYKFTKIVKLENSGVNISYKIENLGKHILKGFYTVHMLVNCAEDMMVSLDEDIKEVINVSDSKYLGPVGKIHSYPITKDIDGNDYDLRKVFPKESGKYEKIYGTKPSEIGSCSYVFPSEKLKYDLKYDPKKLPYIGLWITEGGFRGDYNCALEPSGGYYDSFEIASKNDKIGQINPGEKFEFDLDINISQL